MRDRETETETETDRQTDRQTEGIEEYLTYLPSTLRQKVLTFSLSSHRHTCPAKTIVRYPEGRKNNYILFVTVVR